MTTAGQPAADSIFLGGTIVTVDPALPEAEALAVRDGRIVAVGSRTAVLAHRGETTTLIDLHGSALLPGFVEAHGHPYSTATALGVAVDVRPFGTPTAVGVMQKLREAVAAAAAGQSVVLYGIDPLLHRGLLLPRMADLDALAPDNPLLLITNNGHAAYGNRQAFTQAGVYAETPDPPGARFLRDERGELTGVAEEAGAIGRLTAPIFRFVTDDWARARLHDHFYALASAGLTTCSDHALARGNTATYQTLAAEPGTPLRIRAYEIGGLAGETPAALPAGDELYRQIGVKFWADGSPFVGNIAVSQPYRNNSTTLDAMRLSRDHRGPLNHTTPELQTAIAAYVRAGYQIAVHAHGDLAIDQVLNILETLLHDTPQSDHRLRLEHCGVIRDDQLERVARLDATVSFFMTHVYYWGDVLRDALFPPAIAERWSATGSALRAGVRFSLHNDGIVSPPSPLLNIQIAVTRRTRDSGRVLGPDQALTVDQAIRAQTLDAAYQLFMEDEVGSIVIGKRADLVRLAANPRTVAADTIAGISVEATYLDGTQVWPRP